MNQPQHDAPEPLVRRRSPEYPPLIDVLRDRQLYPLLRALLRNDIAKLLTSMYYTYNVGGDEVLLDEGQFKVVVGSIGRAIGNPRLRVTAKRVSGLQGQLTYVLSPAAKQGLLLEMAALLANLSAHEIEGLPALHSVRMGEGE